MEQRLGVVTLGVRDIARARRFYEEGLDWHRDGGEEDVAFYQSPGMVFALFEWPKLAEGPCARMGPCRWRRRSRPSN
jgi:catechol 2,3-dioxygenase-like lactoylglutathione lyase family enzyme